MNCEIETNKKTTNVLTVFRYILSPIKLVFSLTQQLQ